ncbi:hypothetical protein, partial [Paracoccus aeridis]|uniref:hypothetical protein n=1 Tax=Paracoccus aeridis TaxID=1966466 RepID=UPI0013757466
MSACAGASGVATGARAAAFATASAVSSVPDVADWPNPFGRARGEGELSAAIFTGEAVLAPALATAAATATSTADAPAAEGANLEGRCAGRPSAEADLATMAFGAGSSAAATAASMAERAGGLAAFSDALPEDDFVEEDFSEDDFSGEADAEADLADDFRAGAAASSTAASIADFTDASVRVSPAPAGLREGRASAKRGASEPATRSATGQAACGIVPAVASRSVCTRGRFIADPDGLRAGREVGASGAGATSAAGGGALRRAGGGADEGRGALASGPGVA